MRSLWLGTAVVLLTFSGTAPGGAATIGLPAPVQLTAEASGATVVQIKKKNKRAKRHGHRKKLRRHGAHRHRAPRIVVRPHRHEYVIIHRVPNVIVRLRPTLEPAPREYRRALQPPDTAAESGPSQPALDPITCDEGVSIVREFGFSDVKARACSGPSYDFAAVRDGQPYAIRMRSADGELIEVRRQ